MRERDKGLFDAAKGLARKALAKAAEKLMGTSSTSPVQASPPEAPDRVTPPGPVPPAPPAPAAAAGEAPSSPTRPPPAPPPGPPPEPFGMLDLEEPPDTYGVDEVAVLARDPFTLFVYWEITGEGRTRARDALAGDGALVLRLFSVRAHVEGGVETATHDVELDRDHGRRYLGAPWPGAAVSAAVGLRAPDGRFAPIAHSPRVKVPYAGPGPDGPVEWMEVRPSRTRGARLERPEVVKRGPARDVRGAGAVPGVPRWHQGAWEHPSASRVPPRPGEGELPSAREMPSSPWLWQRNEPPKKR